MKPLYALLAVALVLTLVYAIGAIKPTTLITPTNQSTCGLSKCDCLCHPLTGGFTINDSLCRADCRNVEGCYSDGDGCSTVMRE